MADAQRSVSGRGGLSPASRLDSAIGPANSHRRSRRDQAIALRNIVSSEVIPRLRGPGPKTTPSAPNRRHSRSAPGSYIVRATRTIEANIGIFVNLLLTNDLSGARTLIDATRGLGRTLESIYLDVFQPAASSLQGLWSTDRIGLGEVTLALLDLQSLLRQAAPAFYAETDTPDTGHRILLAAPLRIGEARTSAIAMMIGSQFYRRGGWEPWIEHDMACSSFDEAIQRHWFDLVEIILDSERDADLVAASIRSARRRSPNPSLRVIVRGQNFIGNPGFCRRIGADLASPDPRASLMLAEEIMGFANLGMGRGPFPSRYRTGGSATESLGPREGV